ncbi:hypothetical protein E2C01_075548 [Portunus trituberculatus]|uniref:Uncharacterized protein n=1 Tax=Portunus trituberculatus TaxID=210409 RepID=A0A5B7I8V4_PORTR|nr:hypothetical protein [Portunus trituberculatus]
MNNGCVALHYDINHRSVSLEKFPKKGERKRERVSLRETFSAKRIMVDCGKTNERDGEGGKEGEGQGGARARSRAQAQTQAHAF